jgi:hypothetical protein
MVKRRTAYASIAGCISTIWSLGRSCYSDQDDEQSACEPQTAASGVKLLQVLHAFNNACARCSGISRVSFSPAVSPRDPLSPAITQAGELELSGPAFHYKRRSART